jgi:lipoprotein NlpD|tara:strand:- start:15172 stop:15963 length:792 start_codon:yes stop_codon:yes gene_type:complete
VKILETITRNTLVTVVALLISGCVGNPVIPVSDLTRVKTKHSARIVRSGDTLYTIAWEAGLDYRDVARWNKLVAPFRLTPGDRVVLSPEGRNASTGTNKAQVAARPVKPATGARATSLEPKDNSSSANATAEIKSNSISSQNHEWVWPGEGEVITRFDVDNGDNGIDISGAEGSPVRAAAPGRIVYAGSGLRGYGLLLIVKHDETYLSAYAHNRLLLVSEGDEVGKGQVVAEMGSSGAKSTRLHFEIRQDGKPIDPLKYLPAR